jgi:glycosyltransferase involved in cell wall biosynthesis
VKILFLDQSGKSGGAELCLLDIARNYRDQCLVGLFENGPFRELLDQHNIPVQVLTQRSIQVRKDSGLLKGLASLGQLWPLIVNVATLSRNYDIVYANTQKALVVGAIASLLSRRPLVYHLHDILSPEHFSATNRRLSVAMANRAKLVIANSEATRSAFIKAGGRSDIIEIVYNGFNPEPYLAEIQDHSLRASLNLGGRFVVGHFSRLSPWKGQHILLEALSHCSENVAAIFVGDALFGEQEYVQQLHTQVEQLGLRDRVRFLGFRADVIPVMKCCDAIAHTSTAAEPFGRVIVEAMLCGKPAIAAKGGATSELIEHGVTGWLTFPGDAQELAHSIEYCHQHPIEVMEVAKKARSEACHRFHLDTIHEQMVKLLEAV